jgi:hypothetical protein
MENQTPPRIDRIFGHFPGFSASNTPMPAFHVPCLSLSLSMKTFLIPPFQPREIKNDVKVRNALILYHCAVLTLASRKTKKF